VVWAVFVLVVVKMVRVNHNHNLAVCPDTGLGLSLDIDLCDTRQTQYRDLPYRQGVKMLPEEKCWIFAVMHCGDDVRGDGRETCILKGRGMGRRG
jgi:hypothetical protein